MNTNTYIYVILYTKKVDTIINPKLINSDKDKLSNLILEINSSSIFSLLKEFTIPETIIIKVKTSSPKPFSIHPNPVLSDPIHSYEKIEKTLTTKISCILSVNIKNKPIEIDK
ncbi:hypothetical protein N9186_01650 [Flavobacteriaceae bacterium]|nr:hypothetical protein [Flavobacteriaceae bacterium]